MLAFYVIAALMIAAALAFVLVPLTRNAASTTSPGGDAQRLKALDQALAAGVISEEEYAAKRATFAVSAPVPVPRRPRAALYATLTVALLLPASALMLYRLIGAPQALDPALLASEGVPADHGADMEQAIAGLAAKLQKQPDDPGGWALLGRAYQAMERFPEARDAFKHALDLQPDNADFMLEYAQGLALATPEHRLAGASRDLIDKALKADPSNQRGLWLLGISDYQAKDYTGAIATWNRLLPMLPKDSDIARNVAAQIADARKLVGGTVNDIDTTDRTSFVGPERPQGIAVAASTPEPATTAPATKTASTPTSATNIGPRLTVHVVLDPGLKGRLAPGDTLFVYARAASGPPMPLAIQRMSADRLPVTVTLDDSMGMMPSLKLSMFPQVVIGARVSKSGNALPQSGDLQIVSAPIDVNRKGTIELTIAEIVP